MRLVAIGSGVWVVGLALTAVIAFALVGARSETVQHGDAAHAAPHDTTPPGHEHDHVHAHAQEDGHADGHDTHNHEPLPLTPAAADSIYHLDHTWRDQHEHPLALRRFAGTPVLVTMFYGNCQTACPLLLHRARLLQHAMAAPVPVVAITFDPVSDTPEAMRHYAAERGFDGDAWHFLMGSATSIRMLATLLGVQYHRRADGHYDHSNLIALLDADGVVRWRAEGLSPDVAPLAAEIEALLQAP